jgi:hypothetical protein
MYTTVLLLHSWLRWAVILAGLFVLVRAYGGWSGRKTWTGADDTGGFWFILLLDIQVVLGLILYFFLSPITQNAMQNFGEAMRVSALRFWAVEHTFGMVVGVALAHIGRVRARKASPARRHRTAAIFYTLALIAILISIPWPGTPAGRVLFRW